MVILKTRTRPLHFFTFTMESINNLIQPSNSFGIRKILDCKITDGGEQMYKVEWEATWENADTLSSCQHLLDEFWSLVNKAKANEKASQHCKEKLLMKNIPENWEKNSDMNLISLSGKDKEDIQHLIQRTNKTSFDSSSLLVCPSEIFASGCKSQSKSDWKGFMKSEKESSATSDTKSIPDGLKYIENFTNPYVKLQAVCVVCNKEQSIKASGYWKQHYMTHEKIHAHKCPHCSMSFIKPNRMRKHVAAKHKDLIKQEDCYLQLPLNDCS